MVNGFRRFRVMDCAKTDAVGLGVKIRVFEERAREFECAGAADTYDADSASAGRCGERNDGVCGLHCDIKRREAARVLKGGTA